LRDPMLGLRILSILGQTGFNPRRLEIEITESALVGNIGDAQTVIDDLRRAGVRIALDDFGTGYATLTQLLSFHLDKIKIDRSFVSRLNESEDSQVIVRAILGIANGFGLTTTAEGVEDATQLACLKANGCGGRVVLANRIYALVIKGVTGAKSFSGSQRGKVTCSARPFQQPISLPCLVARPATLPLPEFLRATAPGNLAFLRISQNHASAGHPCVRARRGYLDDLNPTTAPADLLRGPALGAPVVVSCRTL
jgi:hypothetical protein